MRNMSISVRPDAAAADVVKPVLGFLTGGGLLAYMKAQPFYTNLIIATVKTALCDLLVQRYIERREQIDWRRNAVFVAFGGIYLGAGQWFLYQTLFARWFPGMAKFAAQPLAQKLRNVQGMRDLAKQIAVDNFFHYTFIYFPVFYALKECMQGESSAAALLPNAMRKYASNAVEDNVSMWLLWVPCDAIIYAIPLWMRLPANHAISFCWTCYLSFLRGDEAPPLPTPRWRTPRRPRRRRRRERRARPFASPPHVKSCILFRSATRPPNVQLRSPQSGSALRRHVPPGLCSCCVRRLPTTSWTMSSALRPTDAAVAEWPSTWPWKTSCTASAGTPSASWIAVLMRPTPSCGWT